MKLQIFTLDIAGLLDEKVLNSFAGCVSTQRQQKAYAQRAVADQARTIGAGILLAIAYEQFHNRERESANADSLFTYPYTSYVVEADNGLRVEQKKIEACEDNLQNNVAFMYDVNMLCKLKEALPKENVTSHGKPFFEAGPYFNISHAKERVAVVVADRQVGIDIEAINSYKESVVKRSFLPEEIDRLASCKVKDRDALFTELWTTKEAYAKLSGRGLADILDKKIPSGAVCATTWLDHQYVFTIACFQE